MVRAAAIRHVDQPTAVGRPGDLRLFRRRLRNADRVAAVLRGDREDLAVHGERRLLAVWRPREFLELIGEGPVVNGGGGRRAAERDRDLSRLAGGSVHGPDAEI